MPRAAVVDPATKTEIKTVTVTKSIPEPEALPEKLPNLDISEWITEQVKADREFGRPLLVHHTLYLYRRDPNVQASGKGEKYVAKIVNPNNASDIRENERDKVFSIEEIENWQTSFWPEFQHWTRNRFGGGFYRLYLNNTKEAGRPIYCLEFECVGAPQLSSREEYKPGTIPPNASAEYSAMATMAQLLKETLEAVRQNRVNPETAAQTVLDQAEKLNARIMEQVRTQMPAQASPEQKLESMVNTFLKMGLIKATPEPNPAANPFDLMRSCLQALKEFGLLSPPGVATPAGKPLIEQVREVREAAGVLGMVSGGSNSGVAKTTFWDVLKEPQVLQFGHAILTRIVDRIDRKPAVVAEPVVMEAGRPALAQPTPRPPMPPGPPPGHPGSPAPPTPAAAPPPPPAPIAPAAPTPQMVQQIITTFIQTRLTDFVIQGADPYEVGYFVRMADPETASRLAVMTPALLIAYIRGGQAGPLKQLVDDPRLEPFFNGGFFNGLKGTPPVEEPEEPEASGRVQ